MLIVVILNCAFSSCSKDDDDDSSIAFDKGMVVGKWTITSVNGMSTWNWIKEGNTLTFNSDGSCTTSFSMENVWKLENGKIATYYGRTLEPMLIYSLLSISGSEYTVKVTGTLDESNESVQIIMKK